MEEQTSVTTIFRRFTKTERTSINFYKYIFRGRTNADPKISFVSDEESKLSSAYDNIYLWITYSRWKVLFVRSIVQTPVHLRCWWSQQIAEKPINHLDFASSKFYCRFPWTIESTAVKSHYPQKATLKFTASETALSMENDNKIYCWRNLEVIIEKIFTLWRSEKFQKELAKPEKQHQLVDINYLVNWKSRQLKSSNQSHKQ
jgi:hypothetical protein